MGDLELGFDSLETQLDTFAAEAHLDVAFISRIVLASLNFSVNPDGWSRALFAKRARPK